MYSLASLVVELQSARRRLSVAFEGINGMLRPGYELTTFPTDRNRSPFYRALKAHRPFFDFASDNPHGAIGKTRQAHLG